jgi:CheY-like chemotaxis protein
MLGNVLVIDDEPDVRALMAEVLMAEGFTVATADSGPAAVKMAREQRFDVAITDFQMPGMGGAETVGALREADPEVAIIVVSGFGKDQVAQACMARGACDFITKPYDLDTLIERVSLAAGRASAA